MIYYINIHIFLKLFNQVYKCCQNYFSMVYHSVVKLLIQELRSSLNYSVANFTEHVYDIGLGCRVVGLLVVHPG